MGSSTPAAVTGGLSGSPATVLRAEWIGSSGCCAVVAGKSLGVEQVSAGWSDVYVYEKRFLQYGGFTTARNKAKAAGAGAWTLCGGDFHRPL